MGPRSPTMAFEPTPALEHNKENYSPFGLPDDTKPDDDYHRTVHFSDLPKITSPVKRSQSLTNPQNIPLLEPISSASQIPRSQASSIRFKNAVPEIDMDTYLEHTRSVIEGQREGFEKEKKAFDRERKMWDAERSMLKARIAELESRLKKPQGVTQRRYSNDATAPVDVSKFRSTYETSVQSITSSGSSSRHASQDKGKITSPIWEGPENAAPVTRVFSNEDQKPVATLPSISEDEGDVVTLKANGSALPIPIETIDKELEGIMIKAAALAPSFVARINADNQSPTLAPSAKPRASDGFLSLEINNLLSPLDEKLKRDAGHTPMNFGTNGASTDANSTELPTPKEEVPPEPTHTAVRPPLRPSEKSDSYFSIPHENDTVGESSELTKAEKIERRRTDVKRGTLSNPKPNPPVEEDDALDQDPALKGPLMLDSSAKLKSSNSFLDLVDAKLNEELKHNPGASPDAEQADTALSPKNGRRSPQKDIEFEREQAEREAEDGMPKLKIKRSMNFGSAWGGSFPGRQFN